MYQQSSGVQHFSSAPRFGHSRDVASLFDAATDEKYDYAWGLAWMAGALATCFLIFITTIIIFKCCGKWRVGFLSGAHFRVNLDEVDHGLSNSFEDEICQDKHGYGDLQEQYPEQNTQKMKKRKGAGCFCCHGTIFSVRFTFMLSGCVFITFAILMVVKGVTNLQNTVRSVHHSATNIEYMSSEAQDILQNGIRKIQTTAQNVRAALEEELQREDFCPHDVLLGINKPAADWTSKASQAVAELHKIDVFVDDRVNGIVAVLSEAGGQSQAVVDQVGDVDLTDWEALLILIVYTLIPCLLVSAAILAHFDIESPCFYSSVDYIVLPLFIFMVLVCVVVSCAMLAVAAVNSDFCLPGGRPEDTYPGISPDTSVLRFLDANGFVGEKDDLRRVADWYINQCQTEEADDPFDFMTRHLPDLVRFELISRYHYFSFIRFLTSCRRVSSRSKVLWPHLMP